MRGSILVAEDEATARSSLVEILSEEGYQVYEAADGQATVQLLEELDLDLVLCDLKMPGSDGLTVLRQVRERAPQTLVLLMTAYGSVETAVEALRWGVQTICSNPCCLRTCCIKSTASSPISDKPGSYSCCDGRSIRTRSLSAW